MAPSDRAILVTHGPAGDLPRLARRVADRLRRAPAAPGPAAPAGAPAPARVICADGGARTALDLGLEPAVVVGDFDSLDAATLGLLQQRGARIVRVPGDKDATDAELAIGILLDDPPGECLWLGAAGGRLDHTLTNLQALPGLEAAGVATLVLDAFYEARCAVPGRPVTVAGAPGRTVSLVPLDREVRGVTATGFQWPLCGARLGFGSSLGVSNRLTEPPGRVSVEAGALLVVAWDGPPDTVSR